MNYSDDDGAVDVSEVVHFTVPKLRQWNSSQLYAYNDISADYESIEELNSAINKARKALFEINDKINGAERQERIAKTKYEREHRRAYLGSNEKTEAARKARADLLCEELENDTIIYEQVRGELVRMSNAIRLELQTLQSLGNNIRQQLKME